MASNFYDIGRQGFIDSNASRINLSSDTIKVRPTRTSAYTFAATHTTMTSVTAATGGPGDVTCTVTLKTGTDGGDVDLTDAVFTAWTAGAAIDSLVIFKFVTNDAGSTPIAYIDTFTSVVPNGGDITFVWANSTPWVFTV